MIVALLASNHALSPSRALAAEAPPKRSSATGTAMLRLAKTTKRVSTKAALMVESPSCATDTAAATVSERFLVQEHLRRQTIARSRKVVRTPQKTVKWKSTFGEEPFHALR